MRDHRPFRGLGALAVLALAVLAAALFDLRAPSRASAGESGVAYVDTSSAQTLANKTATALTITPPITVGGLAQTPMGILFAQTTATTTANTTVTASMLGAGTGTLTIPANYLTAGRGVHFHLAGIYSTKATAGNETMAFYLAGSSAVSSGAAAFLGTAAQTNQEWIADFDLVCVTTGAGGTAYMNGRAYYIIANNGDNNIGISSTTTVSINTTVANAIDLRWTWGTADPSNSITTQAATVWALN